jgi:hypothetical protein
MYGQIFSNLTLVVTTGMGFPEFPSPPSGGFTTPPLAFMGDCGTTPTLDCAAETAILAYFAGPPIGGPNAKATQESGLNASGGTVLSDLSVKWLAQATRAPGLSVLSGSTAVVSRMLGGLQFAGSFSTSASPEQTLYSVLQNYFDGTSMGSFFGDSSTPKNGSQPVVNAPINYLQVWDDDIIYAAGLSGCGWKALTSKPGTNGDPPGCTPKKTPTLPIPTPFGTNLTAQYLLTRANLSILTFTAEPVTLGPLGCSGINPATGSRYVQRNAFLGDFVCTDPLQQAQAVSDNIAAMSKTMSTFAPGSNYTAFGVPPPVIPYGLCESGFQWRQAYMGDYACVASSTETSVVSDNAMFGQCFCYKNSGGGLRHTPPCS